MAIQVSIGAAASTFSLSWSHFVGYGTGTSTLNILVNGNNVVQSFAGDSGVITNILSTDQVTYNLSGTSVNFNNSGIHVYDNGGTIQLLNDCNLDFSSVAGGPIYLDDNTNLQASSDDYIDGCP